jgi:hypothetical protein
VVVAPEIAADFHHAAKKSGCHSALWSARHALYWMSPLSPNDHLLIDEMCHFLAVNAKASVADYSSHAIPWYLYLPGEPDSCRASFGLSVFLASCDRSDVWQEFVPGSRFQFLPGFLLSFPYYLASLILDDRCNCSHSSPAYQVTQNCQKDSSS